MREIKFRAWDRKTKRMVFKVAGYSSTREEIPIDQVGESEYGEDPFFAVQFEVVYKEVFEGKETMVVEYILYDQIFHNDRFVPMEFTGLKDSKGKEIYEGDILSCTRKIILEGKIDEIKKVLYCEYTEMFARFSFRCEYEQNSPYSLDDFDSFEVIGNIYENPDLLSY